MKICHLSDIHIRNFQYHKDYKKTFSELFSKLSSIKPDIIVNTGDTAHTTTISPEFVDLCFYFFEGLGRIAPVLNILGNHDVVPNNKNRTNAIEPIVNYVKSVYPIFLLDKIQRFQWDDKVDFYIFSEPKEQRPENYDKINIGLFHGPVNGADTDTGWRIDDSSVDVSIFKNMDFMLLGDIHKQQFIDDENRAGYAGSLIQQNFGEEANKGFLLWDIKSKDDFTVKHIELKSSKLFQTIILNEDFSLPDQEIEEGMRIRIVCPNFYTMEDKNKFVGEVEKKYKPSYISVPPTKKKLGTDVFVETSSMNIRDVNVQNSIIEKVLIGKGIVDKEFIEEIKNLNKKYFVDSEHRNIEWKIKSIKWTNLFGYGSDNFVDFTKLNGVSGIFGPNSYGKSSFIDILSYSLFNKITKPISRNVNLINDEKNDACVSIVFESGGKEFSINRNLKRIVTKNDVRGQFSLDFSSKDKKLNGKSKNDTEASIRDLIGTVDDFQLTSLLSQKRSVDLIDCKPTDRKKTIHRFLDLDVFEQKEKLAKEDSRDVIKRLKSLNKQEFVGSVDECLSNITEYEKKLEEYKKIKNKKDEQVSVLGLEKTNLLSSKKEMEEFVDFSEKKYEELSEAIDIERQDIKRLEEEIEKVTTPEEVEFDTSEKNKLSRFITDKKTKLSSIKNDLQTSKKSLEVLNEVPCGTNFPDCVFIRDALQNKITIGDLEQKHLSLEKEVEELDNKFSELENKEVSFIEMLNIKNELLKQNEKLKIKKDSLIKKENVFSFMEQQRLIIEENRQAIETNKNIDKSILSVEQDIQTIKKEVEEIENKIIACSRNLGAEQQKKTDLEVKLNEIEELEKQCSFYECYLELVGKNGIPNNILESYLPLLNEEINKVLSDIVDFSLVLKKENNDDISINIRRNGRDRVVELGGGAENMFSSIAIRTALLNITNLPKSDTFIIDEGFGSLDANHLSSINKMFDVLRTMFNKILVISHIKDLREIVDNNIDIYKEDSFSKIEM